MGDDGAGLSVSEAPNAGVSALRWSILRNKLLVSPGGPVGKAMELQQWNDKGRI